MSIFRVTKGTEEQQARGRPLTEEEVEANKDLYVRQYEEKEGITLTKEDIKRNPGLRSVGKLMLNR